MINFFSWFFSMHNMKRLTYSLVFFFAAAICEIVIIKKPSDIIYIGHTLFTISIPTWTVCAHFCSRVQVCRSMNFIAWNQTCEINNAEPGESTCGLIESTGNSFVASSTFPKQLAGQCNGNSCKCNEACMPKRQDYYCVPIPIDLSECSKPLRPHDCSEGSKSGVYTIYSLNETIDVYCEMDIAGFGWTVFQSRMNGAIEFYRSWIDYENGFGSLTSEFWLGNTFIHLLTSTGDYKLFIHLEDFEGNSAYAEYSEFSLGGTATDYTLNVGGYCGSAAYAEYSEFNLGGTATDYTLNVGGYCGSAGDSLNSHNGTSFSTHNRDNDKRWRFNCARNYNGAWWFNACHTAHLNGQYFEGTRNPTYRHFGIMWTGWKGTKYTLKSTKMMMKRH